MRILHTSDWHLGKFFHERSLLPDQKFVLEQIIEVLDRAEKDSDPFSALLVAGDIYDRSFPPEDATIIFSEFLFKVRTKFPKLHLFFISGNHDSAARLSFASSLLESQNIHIATKFSDPCRPFLLSDGKESIAVYQIPFLLPLSVDSCQEGRLLRKQEELYEEALSKIKKYHEENHADCASLV
nr:exonuclease subunit SbcD [Treponemataceae bacterium]